MSERIGKYLSVRDEPVAPGRKTRVWSVLTNHGDVLGFVRWFGRWRQYTFDPATGTGFNRDCLLDIATYLERVNTEHRDKHKKTRVTLTCGAGCGNGQWLDPFDIDISTSGHTDVRCPCGGTMVAS